MSIHLNSNGSLTKNQRDAANNLNINHMDYRMVVLQNVDDTYEKIIKEDNEPVTIQASNPYIIIGHGPGWEKEAEKIRGTNIPIISTDVCTVTLIEMGIIPNYILTFEEALKRINSKLFPYDKIKEHNIKVVGSKLTRDWLDEGLEKVGMKLERYRYEIAYCSHVGLFASMFARDILKADKIILIGMKCWDKSSKVRDINWNYINKVPPFLNWYTHWRAFLRASPKGMVVNCSQGGIIYVDGVIRADFANLVVKNG